MKTNHQDATLTPEWNLQTILLSELSQTENWRDESLKSLTATIVNLVRPFMCNYQDATRIRELEEALREACKWQTKELNKYRGILDCRRPGIYDDDDIVTAEEGVEIYGELVAKSEAALTKSALPQKEEVGEIESVTLCNRLEGMKHPASMAHPRGRGYNEGIEAAIMVIRNDTRAPTNQGRSEMAVKVGGIYRHIANTHYGYAKVIEILPRKTGINTTNYKLAKCEWCTNDKFIFGMIKYFRTSLLTTKDTHQ